MTTETMIFFAVLLVVFFPVWVALSPFWAVVFWLMKKKDNAKKRD